MQQLKSGSLLQGGKYKIEKVLGQGGFGITYLAIHELLNRKVAIKEFFYKDYCERDEATSHVTLGTNSNRELVERFMEKFIKEARTISTLNHPHIIRIYDIFKENNTAYYVMEYIEGMSLAEMVKQQGTLPEDMAVVYIKQVASALEFVHQHSINHLDVKPANIMVRKEDNQAVLIDFGLSKQYDASGEQTSTTPVGISHGYAPMEQYNVGGVSTFSPQTDIYSLGATLYKLVTGNTPPQAIEIFNDGLPELPGNVSSRIKEIIKKSMQPKKTERYSSIEEFVSLLNKKEEFILRNEQTKLIQTSNPCKQTESILTNNESKKTSNYSLTLICSFSLLVGIIVWGISVFTKDESSKITNSTMVTVEMEQQRINDSIAKVRLLDEQRKKDSIRREEAKKRRKDSIDVLNEQARLATIRKLEEEQRKKDSIDTVKEQIRLAKIHEQKEEKRKEPNITTMLTGSINGHGYVDLGLSVKWAICNIGATFPWEYGDYYAWGEIDTKDKYSRDNHKIRKEKLQTFNISGNLKYDAALANWGSSWRLPTYSETSELIEKCKWEWGELYGHKGVWVIGPNSRSIFFPAAGNIDEVTVHSCDCCGINFWISSDRKNEVNGFFAPYLQTNIEKPSIGVTRGYFGLSVRAVSK